MEVDFPHDHQELDITITNIDDTLIGRLVSWINFGAGNHNVVLRTHMSVYDYTGSNTYNGRYWYSTYLPYGASHRAPFSEYGVPGALRISGPGKGVISVHNRRSQTLSIELNVIRVE